jgi:hypothetical protein
MDQGAIAENAGEIMSKPLVFAAVALLTLLGYFVFPGHTYLQSDTQIYTPMLERLWNPALFANEPLALHPHLAFTIYDEVALALRRATGFDFRIILTLQQLLFRALGIFGVYLFARSLKLSGPMALLTAAAFSLGATIAGPAILTFEYEPVPRAFAVMLVFFAIGLAAEGWDLAAGAAGALAFLYHPPTSLPFWIVYGCLTLWPTRPAIMSRRIMGLLPLAAAAVVLLVFSRLQPGVTEMQQFFGRIGPAQEKLQRLRAPYNWISLWDGYWIWQYLFLWLVSIAAFFRIRKFVPQDAQFFLLGLPLLGVASMPVSYFLLEQMRWIVAPQFQFARALLFVTAMAGIAATAAGIRAAQNRKAAESVAWFLLVFAIPVNARLLDLLSGLADPAMRRRLAVAAALACCASLVAWIVSTRTDMRAGLLILAAVPIPFFLIPALGKVQNYPKSNTPELAELARWARSSTPRQSVFLFPDADRGLDPGIFRAEALRAVYVDWKTGGQVNFMKQFGEEWWKRWQMAMTVPFSPSMLPAYSKLGIDFVAVNPAHRIPGLIPAFSNGVYIVYATNPPVSTPVRSALSAAFPARGVRFWPARFFWGESRNSPYRRLFRSYGASQFLHPEIHDWTGDRSQASLSSGSGIRPSL